MVITLDGFLDDNKFLYASRIAPSLAKAFFGDPSVREALLVALNRFLHGMARHYACNVAESLWDVKVLVAPLKAPQIRELADVRAEVARVWEQCVEEAVVWERFERQMAGLPPSVQAAAREAWLKERGLGK